MSIDPVTIELRVATISFPRLDIDTANIFKPRPQYIFIIVRLWLGYVNHPRTIMHPGHQEIPRFKNKASMTSPSVAHDLFRQMGSSIVFFCGCARGWPFLGGDK